jgi:hypothetical protein
VDDSPHPGFGSLDVASVSQHEWYAALRRSGFTRMEALYIVTRSLVESARLSWLADNPDHAQPQ